MLNLPDITSKFSTKTIFAAAFNALKMLYKIFVGEV
jgi:hypothetical protein